MDIQVKLVVTKDDDYALWGFIYQALNGDFQPMMDDRSKYSELEEIISGEINRFANRCFNEGVKYQKQQSLKEQP